MFEDTRHKIKELEKEIAVHKERQRLLDRQAKLEAELKELKPKSKLAEVGKKALSGAYNFSTELCRDIDKLGKKGKGKKKAEPVFKMPSGNIRL